MSQARPAAGLQDREMSKMENSKASRTAQGTAFFRAIESTRPERERVCFDPVAKKFLGPSVRLAGTSRRIAALWYALLKRQGLGHMYGEVVTRTKYIDDRLEESLHSGIEQVIILGAGYDSRACRFDNRAGRVRFFELDHPATQVLKRRALARARGPEPAGVTYVPIDFGKDDLASRLLEAGYQETRLTFFIWEGVTMYLKPDSIDETLRFVAGRSPRGSSIVFNYVIRSRDGSAVDDKNVKQTLERMRKMGEPVVFGLLESNVKDFLEARGFGSVQNAPCAEVGRAYFEAVGRKQEIAAHLGIAYARTV